MLHGAAHDRAATVDGVRDTLAGGMQLGAGNRRGEVGAQEDRSHRRNVRSVTHPITSHPQHIPLLSPILVFCVCVIRCVRPTFLSIFSSTVLNGGGR